MRDEVRNVLSRAALFIGLMMLVLALTIVGHDKIMLWRTQDALNKTVGFFEELLPERQNGIMEDRGNPEMPVFEYKGVNYAALLELSGYGIKLPVAARWDIAKLPEMPCRYSGSPYNGSLIIGGSSTDGQFDFLALLDPGDVVTVTDMKGYVFPYTVETVKHMKASDDLLYLNNEYDLTLFARSTDSEDYLVVYCRFGGESANSDQSAQVKTGLL